MSQDASQEKVAENSVGVLEQPGKKMFSEEYVKELRAENKSWRQKISEVETSLKEMSKKYDESTQTLNKTVSELTEKLNNAKSVVRDTALNALFSEAGITDEKTKKLLTPGILSESKFEVSDTFDVTYDKESTLALIKTFRQTSDSEKISEKPKDNASEIKQLLAPEKKSGLITDVGLSAAFRSEMAHALRSNG